MSTSFRIGTAPASAPGCEPVTLAECKLDSRIDGTEYDALIPDLIVAAREMCEQETGRKLITQTWLVSADDWPDEDDTFALSPFQSATLTYWNGTAWATLASDQYVVEARGGASCVLPAAGASWPSLGDLSGPRVRLSVVCGYGATGASVPGALRLWIRQHVAAFLRAPDGMGDEKKMVTLPYLARLLDGHKAYA